MALDLVHYPLAGPTMVAPSVIMVFAQPGRIHPAIKTDQPQAALSCRGLELGIIRVTFRLVSCEAIMSSAGNGMFISRIVLFCVDCGGIAFQLEA